MRRRGAGANAALVLWNKATKAASSSSLWHLCSMDHNSEQWHAISRGLVGFAHAWELRQK
eukprot:scaffold318152_cov17-Tisochrysis_lutea.AAC.1